MIHTIEASGSGNFTVLYANSYRKARSIAARLRNAFYSRVQVIKGPEIDYDRAGFPTNITDAWATDGRVRNGKPRWVRINP